MYKSTDTTPYPLRLFLLALAIAAITGGCNNAERTHVQAETHANATPTDAESDHGAVDLPTHGDAHPVVDDHAAHTSATSLPTPPAKPWPSDAPLREGMRRMHQAVNALGYAEHDHLDAAQTTTVAQQVQEAANFMLANCKLPPEPDAALHGLLAVLLGGAGAIKANPADISPVASMREAVALYPRIFEDATWQADTGAEQ